MGRRIFDADSHVMEPGDWLLEYADPAVRDRLRVLRTGFDRAKAEEILAQRRADPDKEQRAKDRLYAKGFQAYGAWDAAERSRALDVLGIDAQLVFPTFANGQFAGADPEVTWGGIRAMNRALADFCSDDPRLLAVGFVPLNDPDRATAEVTQAIELGCAAVHLTTDGREKSPSHADYDGIWSRLQDADVPFVTHIGGGGRLVPNNYRDNGRPVPPDMFGGGENIRYKDYLGIPFWPEYFLSVLVLDGVLERFPGLRGAAIEQGAEWIVTMLRRLNHAFNSFKKTDPVLAELSLRPSDYVRRQLKFTPFPQEDVAWLIEQGCADLLLFSSDYPHIEGGRDPISRFDASLSAATDAERESFYSGNFAELLGRSFRKTAVPA